MRFIVLLVTLAATTPACHAPDDYLLSPSQIDRMLTVTVSSSTISADGVSRVTITAQLDPRTDADKRNVTFTTTAGMLIGGGREGMAITVQADDGAKAVAELRSAVVPATAHIEIAAGTIRQTSSVAFLVLARDEVFDVSTSRSTLPADGFSRAVIKAKLDRPGVVQQRTFTFETSAGILIASGHANARTLTVTADAAGEAQVELQSEKTIGTAQVRVIALGMTHEIAIQFAPVDPSQIITVTTERSSAPADGVTPLVISAVVAPGLPGQRRTVTFSTTLGQLIPAAVEADGSNVARTSLISAVVGTARITATVDGTTAEATAKFNPALPNKVHLSVDAAELTSGESTNLRVTLIRTNGTVSPHLSVTYSARTSTNASIGSFSAVTLAESEIATATFNLGTTSYLGPVTIKATAEGGESTSATIQVVP